MQLSLLTNMLKESKILNIKRLEPRTSLSSARHTDLCSIKPLLSGVQAQLIDGKLFSLKRNSLSFLQLSINDDFDGWQHDWDCVRRMAVEYIKLMGVTHLSLYSCLIYWKDMNKLQTITIIIKMMYL